MPGMETTPARLTEPPKKIDTLRALMDAGDWRAAISLASKFPRLGAHKLAILRAQEAYARPDFQRQIGRDPVALIEAGRMALVDGWARKPDAG